MSNKTPVFLIGATGYIGGTVLSQLLAHPSASALDITAIVRSQERAKKLETFGVKTKIGSFKTDLALVEQLAEQAHVVFNCADADDLPATQAILAGLRKRHANTGDLPLLIHTSGTGVLTYGHETAGMSATDTIYDDSNVEQIENISPQASHRNVDLAIVQADKEGFVRTYIILPSTIYGVPSNPLADADVYNTHSIQIPWLVRASLERGQAGVVGKGLALWPSVHIDDTAALYIVLWDAVVARPDAVGHGRDGFYFAENGEFPWSVISDAIGRAMVELGLSTSAEPTPFSDEELVKYWGSVEFGNYWGSNSRARATHSRSLGWKPKYTTDDMIASIKEEVQYYLKQRK